MSDMGNVQDRRNVPATLQARKSVPTGPAAPFPREEVKRAIERRGNCRKPQFFQPVPLFFRNQSLYDFFDTWPCDLMTVGGPKDPATELRKISMLMMEGASVLHGSSAFNHAITDWAQAKDFYDEFLLPIDDEWYRRMAEQIAETPGCYHVAVHLGSLFEPVYLARGMERFFLDLYEHLDEVERVLDRLVEFNAAAMRAFAKAGADGVFMSDDWGAQDSLLIDPALWRAIWKPRYKVIVDAAHEAGVHVIFHSDGNLDSIFPDLIELGFDVLNPLQPGALDVDRWLAEYKGQASFWTGVDVQGMLPFVSPDRVRDEVRRTVEKFHDDRGGHIIGPTNAITAEVPYENLVALYETLMEYR